MLAMQPDTFDPVGAMTWAVFQTSFALDAPWTEFGWGYHSWVGSGSKQYDPSAGVIHSGDWGSYEDACFAKYYRITTVDINGDPTAATWDNDQEDQDEGCEATGVPNQAATIHAWTPPPGDWP